jgi:O-antigen/teichoic acid export membrane protein
MRPSTALRRAAPIGLLALATVAYYRSGTIALAVLADPTQTAAFTVAASIAFGLLLLPNAITTALLPRLSAETDSDGLVASARPALGWTILLASVVSVVAAGVGPLALPLVLGAEYSAAATPFVVLCLGLPIIAASGVIGTALLSVGRTRVLGIQVGCTLVVNVVALALLVPALGAVGASLATIACELTGLVLLVRFARRDLPGLTDIRPPTPRARIEPSTAATP